MPDKNEKQEPQKISGTVDGIVAYKAESGFVVFDLDMQGELVTVVGELGKVEAGEEVSLTGTFASHPTYGTQFREDVCERRLPASATAIRKGCTADGEGVSGFSSSLSASSASSVAV